jgi:thiol-disulfide isomerase/thioredoxin
VRTGYRIALIVAFICAGGAGGFFAAHLSHHEAPAAAEPIAGGPTAAPGYPSEDEAAPDNAPPSRKIPELLPNFSLTGADGVKHALSDWKGRPLMINFWATWCAPCRREIPLLKQLRQQHAADGVEVIGIAVDFRDAVQHYAREMGIDYPVLVGEQDGLDAIAAFGMDTVFPFTVFADRQGRIVTLKVGELHADEAGLILDRLKAVDQGRMELASARKEIADGMSELSAQRAREEASAESKTAQDR